MKRVLLVDDDRALAGIVAAALTEEGFDVTQAHDGKAGLELFTRGGFELVLLDVLMPELDGLTLCRQLRGRVPIVFLSSRGEETDRVLGLDLGADDYVTKPFSPRELVARVGAVLRRTASEAAAVPAARPVLAIGTVTIDRDRHEVAVGGAPLVVTATELRLLSTLAQHRGRVLSRGQLIATVYGDDHHISARTIDTHVRNLRAKLAAAGAPVIETVHGVGYRCS
jgi:two-component system OmpR family response regulator